MLDGFDGISLTKACVFYDNGTSFHHDRRFSWSRQNNDNCSTGIAFPRGGKERSDWPLSIAGNETSFGHFA
jgi:hypothetical protein